MELGLAQLVGLRSDGYRRGILDGGPSVFFMVILSCSVSSARNHHPLYFLFHIKRAPSLLFSFASISISRHGPQPCTFLCLYSLRSFAYIYSADAMGGCLNSEDISLVC